MSKGYLCCGYNNSPIADSYGALVISIIKPPAMQVECINFSKSMELWVDKKPP